VWTPFGERELRVDDAEGNSLSADVLSRGTREQLFLSLRLALVTLYARRGVRLPLILDDVLVNFDSPRTKAAASVLKDFARAGHQVLLFTCHEHISKLFKSLRADVRVLPDRTSLGAVQPEPAKRKKLDPPEVVEVEPPAEPSTPLLPEPVVETPETIMTVEVLPLVEPPRLAPTFADVIPEPRVVVSAVVELPRMDSPSPPLLAPAIDEPAVAVSVEAPAPLPTPPRKLPKRERKPVRKVLQRIERRVEQIPWDAEEFAGELADRVARPRTVEVLVAEPAENGHAHAAVNDDDSAPVRELTRD
jgi:hypothetical protein